MADSKGAAARGEEAGPAVRAAHAIGAAAEQQAYRAFLDHAQTCTDCRTTGCDCQPAAILKQAWRDAKAAA